MQINKDDLIAGYPVLEIRKIMKRARELKWSSGLIEELLDITPTKAKQLLKELQVQDYIEKAELKEGTQYWKTTLKGNQLALASASQPIKRQTADKLLEGFIGRIYELNSSTHFLYFVRRALLFGSYLTDKERLGDIDIIVEIEPKYSVRKEQMKAEREKINLVKQEGKNFKTFVEELLWPQEEVWRFLKNRNKSLSLHSEIDLELIKDYKEIFVKNID